MRIIVIVALVLLAGTTAFAQPQTEASKVELECQGASHSGHSWVIVSETGPEGRVMRVLHKANGREDLLKEVHSANSMGIFDIVTYRSMDEKFILDIFKNHPVSGKTNTYSAFLDSIIGKTQYWIEMVCQLR